MLRIKLLKSPIGNTASNRKTIAALGLRRVNQTVSHPDTPSVRGMIHKVKHVLSVEEIAEETKAKQAKNAGKSETVAEPQEEKPKAKKAKKSDTPETGE